MRLGGLFCAVLLLVGACDSKGGSMSKEKQFAELLDRPHIEKVEAEYLKMLEEIRNALVNRFGIAPWQPKQGEAVTGSGCGEFPDIAEAEKRRYSSGMSPGNLPDAKWADAVATVHGLASKRGFKAPGVVVDRPSDHEVSLRDDYGAELLFGTAANTTLSLSTGCHLSRKAYESGKRT